MVARQTFSKNNQATFLRNGEEYVDACVEIIKGAKEKILFHTYIFEEDAVSEPFIEALIERSENGVKVFVLLDAFGTPELSDSLKERLKKAGVNRAYFAQFFSRKFDHMGRRLHQKVLIADNDKAIVGGINLSAKFIRPDDDRPWLDYAVLVHGDEVHRLQRKVLRLYEKYFHEHKSYFKSSLKKETFSFQDSVAARTVVNDFMRFRTEIHQSYIKAIREAKKSIKITATYFLPGKRLLRELRKASNRGVEIELIFGERSDHQLERWSSRYLYSWYLKHDLKVYEWGKSIIHAKAALIDDEWVSIGSYNHNYISRYACLEINVEIKSEGFAQELNKEFEKIKSSSHQISKEQWRENVRWHRSVFYFLTYAFSNVVTFLSLLFVFRSKEKTEVSSR